MIWMEECEVRLIIRKASRFPLGTLQLLDAENSEVVYRVDFDKGVIVDQQEFVHKLGLLLNE